MSENMTMESMNETLLKWDRQCIKQQLGSSLAAKCPDLVGPEAVMLRTLMEYFSLYILDLTARSEHRFEVKEIHQCGNYYSGSNVDMPDDLRYFVVFKKLNPEACFFEDVEFGNTGGCRIRVGERTVKEEWADCLNSDGFLSSQSLTSSLASCIQRCTGVLNPTLYPEEITYLLPKEELPYISQCNVCQQGVQLIVVLPFLQKLSWKIDYVRICLIPSIRFPGWPSSADFPDRVSTSHPLYTPFKDAASNGFYVSPKDISLPVSISPHDSSAWQVCTVTMATQLLNQSPIPLAGNIIYRTLSGLLGRCHYDKIMGDSSDPLHLKSSVTEEMIATATLWEIEQNANSQDWIPLQTAERVMNALSRLQHAFQESPMRDYFFPSRTFPEDGNSFLVDEIVGAFDFIKVIMVERIHLDLGQSREVKKQQQLLESVQQNDQLLRFIESPSVKKFPRGANEAWQIFAEIDLLSYKIYEQEPRSNVLEFALMFTESDNVYKAVIMCEFFRQHLTGDADPIQSLQRALQHTRQAMSNQNPMAVYQDMDPYMGDALWFAAQSSALHSGFVPNTTVQEQPVPGSQVTQSEGWGSSGGGNEDMPLHDGFTNGGSGGGTFDDGAIGGHGDSGVGDGCCGDGCCGDGDCCGDCSGCDCGDCNCDCNFDCTIM